MILEINQSPEKIEIYLFDLNNKFILVKLYNKYELILNVKNDIKNIFNKTEILFLFNGLKEYKVDDELIKNEYKFIMYWHNEILI